MLDVSSKVEAQIFKNASMISDLIKRKYEITALAQNLFTHDRVQTYIGEITSAVDAVLRDTCDSCGFEHNLRTKTLAALERIGSI